MPEERSAMIGDELHVELVDCTPEPEVRVELPAVDASQSPTQAAMTATIECTGADPPPVPRSRALLHAVES